MTDYEIDAYNHLINAEIETYTDWDGDGEIEDIINEHLSREGLLKCLGLMKKSDSIEDLAVTDNEIRVTLKNKREYEILVQKSYESEHVFVDGVRRLKQHIILTSDHSHWDEETARVYFADGNGLCTWPTYDRAVQNLASSIYWFAEGHKESNKFDPQAWS